MNMFIKSCFIIRGIEFNLVLILIGGGCIFIIDYDNLL